MTLAAIAAIGAIAVGGCSNVVLTFVRVDAARAPTTHAVYAGSWDEDRMANAEVIAFIVVDKTGISVAERARALVEQANALGCDFVADVAATPDKPGQTVAACAVRARHDDASEGWVPASP